MIVKKLFVDFALGCTVAHHSYISSNTVGPTPAASYNRCSQAVLDPRALGIAMHRYASQLQTIHRKQKVITLKCPLDYSSATLSISLPVLSPE